jgi:predicted ester cyclase
MSTEVYRALVTEYLHKIWNERDLDALNDLLTPDYRRHTSPMAEPLTVDGQRLRIESMQVAFPDLALELHQTVVEGDLVAFHSTMRGTHLGDFRGLAPTGRAFEVDLIDLMRIRAGRIAEHWGGPDWLDLLIQLGATFELP